MLPQLIASDATANEICDLAERWRIHPQLAVKLYDVARLLPFQIKIISGYRTPERQRELLEDSDATAAPVHLSTHTSCPATGADIDPDHEVTTAEKRLIGSAAAHVGLRWGGGARRDNGIPIGREWRHLDLGPRSG